MKFYKLHPKYIKVMIFSLHSPVFSFCIRIIIESLNVNIIQHHIFSTNLKKNYAYKITLTCINFHTCIVSIEGIEMFQVLKSRSILLQSTVNISSTVPFSIVCISGVYIAPSIGWLVRKAPFIRPKLLLIFDTVL